VVYVTLSGALQGGSDTRTPFLARTVGLVVFYLGFSYLFGVVLGYGVLGVYVGIALYYISALCIVLVGFQYGDWIGRATTLMDERGTVEAAED
jgi:Na+-driven multidrug efflux pump